MQLMTGLKNQGYRLYIDNFYTKPQLPIDLLSHGVEVVGTLKTNRQECPELAEQVKTTNKKGECTIWPICFQSFHLTQILEFRLDFQLSESFVDQTFFQ